MKSFSDLTEQELLALAISSEDDDARAYAGFAHSLMDTYPASAKVFMEMAEEEHEHRRWLTDLYAKNILFDYSYRYFYEDGFGKDFQILNLNFYQLNNLNL